MTFHAEMNEMSHEEMEQVLGGNDVVVVDVDDTSLATKATPKLFLHCATGQH